MWITINEIWQSFFDYLRKNSIRTIFRIYQISFSVSNKKLFIVDNRLSTSNFQLNNSLFQYQQHISELLITYKDNFIYSDLKLTITVNSCWISFDNHKSKYYFNKFYRYSQTIIYHHLDFKILKKRIFIMYTVNNN